MIENQTSRVIGILKFLTKDNLLCLPSRIWIKVHFPLECQSTYFWTNSLSRWLIWTYFLPQKIDVSSANNFILDSKSLAK